MCTNDMEVERDHERRGVGLKGVGNKGRIMEYIQSHESRRWKFWVQRKGPPSREKPGRTLGHIKKDKGECTHI